MRLLGIDFGTSNTVAIVGTPDGRIRPLLFDGSPLLPSAIYLGTDGRMLVGRDAERNARVDPARFEPNPKRRIDDGVIFLADRELPVAEAFAIVLGQVVTEARRQLGGNPTEVRMTHPARWGEKRRSVLLEAARVAGLPRPQLIAEPVAAASYFTAVLGTAVPEGRSLAIYDLGGGTFDATVVRRTSGGFEVLAEGGLPDVGGLDFDHAIIEHLGATYSATHPETWQRLEQPRDGTDRRHRRMLWEDVRGAKEMLSRASHADIHLPALEVDAHVTREELEGLIRPYLERTVQCLTGTIADAKLAPKQLIGIFLVGGSSRIPMAAHLIHSQLGVAPTTLEQPETVVAEGALQVGRSAHALAPASPAPIAPVSAPNAPVSGPGARPPITRPPAPIPPHRQQPARPPVGPTAPTSGPGRPLVNRPTPPRAPMPNTAMRPPMRPAGRPPQRPAPPMRPRPQSSGRPWLLQPAGVVTLILTAVLVVTLLVLIGLAIS